jgi:hypothetical protein
MTEQEALRILQVEDGSSPETIRESYLHLVKVWHPDRFEHDPRLRARAERTLREVNEAYGVLQQRGSPSSAAHAASPRAGSPRPGNVSPPPAAKTPSSLGVTLRRAIVAGAAFGVLVAIGFAMWPASAPAALDAANGGPIIDEQTSDAPLPPQRSAVRPPTLEDERRPLSGTGAAPSTRGNGSVAIVNRGLRDAALVLARGGAHVYATYVRAGEKVQIVGVAGGGYDVLLTIGGTWREGRFTENAAYLARDEPLQVQEAPAGERFDRAAATLMVPEAPVSAGFRAIEPFDVRLP